MPVVTVMAPVMPMARVATEALELTAARGVVMIAVGGLGARRLLLMPMVGFRGAVPTESMVLAEQMVPMVLAVPMVSMVYVALEGMVPTVFLSGVVMELMRGCTSIRI